MFFLIGAWRSSLAQPAMAWDQSYGGSLNDELTTIVATADGGYLLGGHSESNANGTKTAPFRGSFDYWVVKTNAQGVQQWDSTYGGINQDELTAMLTTSDGGYLLGGNSFSEADGNKTAPGRGGSDYWIAKINSQGEVQWDRSYGGNGGDQVATMIATADGGYLLGGTSASEVGGNKTAPYRGNFDYWVVKLNSQGEVQWDRSYGGTGYDEMATMISTADGGYLLGGISFSGADGNKTSTNIGDFDYWVVKISSQGEAQWDRSYGGTGFDDLDEIFATADGNYLLGGTSISGVNGNKTAPFRGGFGDYWVVKINTQGVSQWDRSYGGTDSDGLNTMFATSDGGYLLGGISRSEDGNKTAPRRGDLFGDYWLVRLEGCGATVSITAAGGVLSSSQTNGNQWLNSSKAEIAGATAQAYTPTFNGTYYVRYTNATSGCAVLSPGITVTNLTDPTARTASLAAGGIQLYPNPSQGQLNVALATPGSYSLQLTDLQGRVVYTTQLSGSATGTTTTLQLPSLPAGLYAVQISGANGTHSGKLSVQ
ncbi:MAG: T9SS type A sorting domain-containing protein [Sphingobacteriia bacterium]